MRQGLNNVAPIVAEILARYEVEHAPGRKWQKYSKDLANVLARDYEARISHFVAAGELPLRALQRHARSVLPDFGQEPLPFARTVELVCDRRRGMGVNVAVSPYGEPGHPLRGFYVFDGKRPPLIWVNRQHTPTAIGTTFAHELGHHFWTEMAGQTETPARILHHDAFSDHLDDPRELFADSFAAMAGYPHAVARSLFARKSWPRASFTRARGVLEMICRIEKHIHQHYPGDLSREGGLPPVRRLYYLGGMIHFSKLRAAIMRVTTL